MSASNNRVRDYGTIHHLMSRIAHGVFFLGDDERNDLIEMVRRVADFSGIQLLGWCLMTNHFHLLVHLPQPPTVSDGEVLRRYGVLKGAQMRADTEKQLDEWRLKGDGQRAEEWLAAVRRRMYDVGEFMKIIKQWFTGEYNRRHSHRGTLWEAVYLDRPVPNTVKAMSRVLGYIHLNPIRAAVESHPGEYLWSSLCALKRGDELALAGMRFVYDDSEASSDELLERHETLLDGLLEAEKRRRAEEIARRRALGYEVPVDHLTTEAMVAQAAAHLNEVQKALFEMRMAEKMRRPTEESGKMILLAIKMNPTASVATIAELTGIVERRVYIILGKLMKTGELSREKGIWLCSK